MDEIARRGYAHGGFVGPTNRSAANRSAGHRVELARWAILRDESRMGTACVMSQRIDPHGASASSPW